MVDITDTLDCLGDVCPYPDVKTKRKIKKMKSGETLKVLVDYALSAERIPETMEKLGHAVTVEKEGNVYNILITLK